MLTLVYNSNAQCSRILRPLQWDEYKTKWNDEVEINPFFRWPNSIKSSVDVSSELGNIRHSKSLDFWTQDRINKNNKICNECYVQYEHYYFSSMYVYINDSIE